MRLILDRNEVTTMTYKTIVIDYAPKAKKMAAAIEKTANEKAQDGWELVTFSVTNSAKAILVFRMRLRRRQKRLRMRPMCRRRLPRRSARQNEAGNHRHRLQLHPLDALRNRGAKLQNPLP